MQLLMNALTLNAVPLLVVTWLRSHSHGRVFSCGMLVQKILNRLSMKQNPFIPLQVTSMFVSRTVEKVLLR